MGSITLRSDVKGTELPRVEIVQKTTNLGNLSHVEEVRGRVEPWFMARWKARVEFLLGVIELRFYRAPQCWHCKRCTSYTAIPSVCPSFCLSVCPSVRHTPVLCQNDGT